MSSPISAMISCAGLDADTGDLGRASPGVEGPGRTLAYRGVRRAGRVDLVDRLPDPAGKRHDLGIGPVDLVGQDAGQLAMVGVEPAGQRLNQGEVFGAQPAPGQVGQRLRVALAGDERCDHVAGGHGAQGGHHRRHLDQRVFEQLFQPQPVAGAVTDQIHPHAGVVAEHPDRHRRHE